MKRQSVLAAVCSALVFISCDEAPPVGDAGPISATAEIGLTYRLQIDSETRSFALFREGERLLRFGANALQLGVMASVNDRRSYDPAAFYDDSGLLLPLRPDAWLQPEAFEITHANSRAVIVSLRYAEGYGATLSIEQVAEGRFSLLLQPTDIPGAVAYIRLSPEVESNEGFYGLGEHFDHVNSRGLVRVMQLEADPNLEASYNEVHVPVPFVTGTTGWGFFVESDLPAAFALGTETPDRMDATFGVASQQTEGLRFHLYAADHPLDISRHYYETTGYPIRPARWALGPWIWRDENEDQAQVIRDIETLRSLDLAASGYWIDRPYASGVNTFDFDPSMFDDVAGMVARMHALGFRFALWHTPYLDDDDSSTEALRSEAAAGGYFPAEHGIRLNDWSIPLDLTNPDAYAWWQGLIRRYTDLGVEGFKLDFAEDVVVGSLGGSRNIWRFHDGSDERTMHAGYQRFYHRVYAETLPSSGGFLLCRGGTWGDQANVSVIWPGDLDANFARHREVVTDGDETYVAVGGLPAAVVAGLSLGPSGFPLFASDTGGYRHAPPDKETFTRWFEMTALTPVMQIGTNTNDVAWEPTEGNGFDDEMLGWYRAYTRLHLRLFPYTWTYVERLSEDGRPIQRALGLAYPELGEHPDDTFLLGDSIYVAPVVERGIRERSLIMPPGAWVDWWTGQSVEGGRSHTAAAPLETLPLFVAAGAMVPMLRPTIDTLAPTSEPDMVDSYATDAGLLYVLTTAGADSAFTLFDGTQLTHMASAQGQVWRWEAGDEFTQGVVFEIIGVGDGPMSVSDADGRALPELMSVDEIVLGAEGWIRTEARGGTLWIVSSTANGSLIADLSTLAGGS